MQLGCSCTLAPHADQTWLLVCLVVLQSLTAWASHGTVQRAAARTLGITTCQQWTQSTSMLEGRDPSTSSRYPEAEGALVEFVVFVTCTSVLDVFCSSIELCAPPGWLTAAQRSSTIRAQGPCLSVVWTCPGQCMSCTHQMPDKLFGCCVFVFTEQRSAEGWQQLQHLTLKPSCKILDIVYHLHPVIMCCCGSASVWCCAGKWSRESWQQLG